MSNYEKCVYFVAKLNFIGNDFYCERSEAKRSELAREPPVSVWEKETTTYLENEAF